MRVDISDLLGVRYKKNGRNLDGLDCFGLVIEVSKRFGHKLKDFEYKDASYMDFLKAKEAPSQFGNLIKADCLEKAGDLILFKVKCCFDNHIGVYLGDGKFIHCDFFGVRVQDLSEYEFEIGSVYKWQS